MTEETTESGSAMALPATVRPKSSKRKSRSESVEKAVRRPLQARSQERFERIIATLEAMLHTSRFEDISFYDIAEQAGVSPASISYFFPTMTALRIEMIERTFRASAAFHLAEEKRRQTDAGTDDWRAELRRRGLRYREFLRSNSHVAQIALGPMMDIEVRQVSARENDALAVKILDEMMGRYYLPPIPDLASHIAVALEIGDALWSRSYALHGDVTDEAFESAFNASIAYLRLYLPEKLTLRSEA